MSPDPYSGSYNFSNPQSLNRYSYVLDNPLTYNDPSGQCPECIFCLVYPVTCGAIAATVVDSVVKGIEDLFGFGGPSFHGSLKPRPSAAADPGSFGESLGIPSTIPQGNWGLSLAFGLPSEACDFGACGAGPMNATSGAAVYSAVPYINTQTWQQLLAHLYPWYWSNKGGANIVPGTHYCGPGGWGSIAGHVDAACYQHDLCYGKLGINAAAAVAGLVPASAQAGKAACDQRLCQAISGNTSYTPDEMAQQFWVSGYFNCH